MLSSPFQSIARPDIMQHLHPVFFPILSSRIVVEKVESYIESMNPHQPSNSAGHLLLCGHCDRFWPSSEFISRNNPSVFNRNCRNCNHPNDDNYSVQYYRNQGGMAVGPPQFVARYA